MRRTTRNILIAAAFIAALIRSTSLAQTLSPCGVTASGISVYPSYAKTNPAFTATIQTTHEQRFPDGNAIHGMVVTHFYRDAAGRTRSEVSVTCYLGPDGKLRPGIAVTVNDPVNHTTMSWHTGDQDKTARLYHQSVNPPSAAPPVTPEQRAINAASVAHWRETTRTEKLSDSNIAGLPCEHTRTITTTPAGERGNDLPMELTDEICIARGVGLTMLRISDSPLIGRTETVVTDFNLGDPDPSVFVPPPDYTIQEQTSRQVSPVSAQ